MTRSISRVNRLTATIAIGTASCNFLVSGQPWASECPGVKNYKWRLNPVWHRMLYSCTHGAAVGVKGLSLMLVFTIITIQRFSIACTDNCVLDYFNVINSWPTFVTHLTGPHLRTLLTSFVRWQMSRLVSDSVPVHLHHWLSAAPDSLPSVTELSRSPVHVSGTVCQILSLPHLP